MVLLERIRECAEKHPDRTAVVCGGEKLSYRELFEYSDSLAEALDQICRNNREPVAVYGHKNPFMLVCFLACLKSGRAYCPIDVTVPDERAFAIIDMLDSPVVLATEPVKKEIKNKKLVLPDELKILSEGGRKYEGKGLAPEDVLYIIFTSGSTGTPKGVQITADALEQFLNWSATLGGPEEEKRGAVFLNQAPFSFDLSVMDLYTCLRCQGTLWCLTKEVQKDYKELIRSLKESKVQVWVSTPSFAEVCLADRQFSVELLPELSQILFCGETLQNKTVKRLQERFPDAVIVNTYGPTESTVAVTGTVITPKMAEEEACLPVGTVKPGTRIEIQDDTGRWLPEGTPGEIVILGDTVSIGYYRQEEKSRKAFFKRMTAGKEIRGYHTGDKGYLKGQMLYCLGRMDRQVKLHGYRIELEDIENNLMKIDGIRQAVVLPKERDGRLTSLQAYVVCREEMESIRIKELLKTYLPDYMIPKKVIQVPSIPVTENGKTDRKALLSWGV